MMLLFVASAIYSCEESEIDPENPEENSDENQVAEETTIAELQAGNYPTSNLWTITDEIIPDSAFYASDTSNLDISDRQISITFPNTTEVGAYAFYGFTALTSIELPKATIVNEYAFAGCTSITTADLSNITTFGTASFAYCTAMPTLDLPSADSIGEKAFFHCTALTSIEASDATSIGDYAFYSCTTATTIELPSVTSIGDLAFIGCKALTSLEVATESTLTSVGGYILAGVTTTNVDLIIGSGNDDVDTDELTWNGYIFNSITVK